MQRVEPGIGAGRRQTSGFIIRATPYGTALAERGVHERVVQELMGHADSRTTREIYTHTMRRMVDSALAAAAEALDVASGSPIGSPDAHQEPNEWIAETGKARDLR